MSQESPAIKPWKLWTAMVVFTVLLTHLIVESAVQWFFAPRSGVAKYLEDFRAKAAKDGLSLAQYANKADLDDYLGWGGREVRVHEPAAGGKPRTLLFVGDSVTAGHDVQAGVEDYPALLAAQLGGRGLRVVNLAARGYGVDQMWLKLLSKAAAYHPDMIVLAYIPHDLLRPASDFNFGLPKPRFRFDGAKVDLNLALDIQDYIDGFESARSGFRLDGWFIGHYWANKEYHAPGLFGGYYHRLYRHIGENLAKLSQEWGIPVRVVKLTNYHRFGGDAALTAWAGEEFARPTVWDKADVRALDTDACVIPKAQAAGLAVEQEFAHHPGPVGHRLLAECLRPELEAALKLAPAAAP